MSHSISVLLAALLALAFAASRIGDRFLGAVEQLASRWAKRRLTVVISVGLFVIAVRLALLPVFPVPLPAVHDEFSYLLAADTFAHGRLSNPPHPMSLFFDTFHVQQQPTYASIFPPAQGAVLAIGQILSNPWFGVLLSTAVMCAAVTWMLQAWFPPAWALLGGVLVILRLGLFSYWVNSYWGGAVAAIGGALVLGAFRRIVHRYRWRDALLLGFGTAILANSRPLEGLIFSIPVAVAFLLWLLSRHRPPLTAITRRVLVPFAAVMVLAVTFMGYYNWRLTGNALLFPHALYMKQQCNCRVLAWQKPLAPLQYANPQFDDFYNGHVRDRFAPTWQAWKHRSKQSLHGWWFTFLGRTLSIPFITLPWIFRDRRMRLLLIQFFCSTIGLFLVLYFEPHYAAPLVATIFALLVQAMRHLRQWKFWGWPAGIVLTRLVMLAVLVNVPYYIWEESRLPYVYSWSRERARLVQQLDSTPGQHLVIVRYSDHHVADDEWVYNAADIDHAKIVWAREIPEQDLQPLLDYFRSRKIWLVEADASPPRLQPFPRWP